MQKVLVNAMPLTVVGTGIGRYLRGLYSAFEAEYSHEFDLSYFIGNSVVQELPDVQPPGWKERFGQLLWKMPYMVAFGGRLLQHVAVERRFRAIVAKYDIYHEVGYFPLGQGVGGRTVMTVHDLSLLLHPEWHPKERVRYWRMFYKKRFELVDSFLAVSEFTKKEMVRHLSIDPAKITVTPLGVDAEMFNAKDDPEARALIAENGVPEDFLLFVGSGDPRKRLDDVLAAHGLLRSELPLVVVGWSGWETAKRSSVVNMGYISDRILAQLYRQASLLLMPSVYEGFGLPVVEAMACGCPVLSTRAGALKEVGGDAVRYFDLTDSCSLYANEIDELLSDEMELEGMALLGLERAAEFEWKRTARLTRNVLMY